MDTSHPYQAQFDVLEGIDSFVGSLTERHKSQRKLWFSSDFLPASEKNSETDERVIMDLRERAKTLPDAIRVSLDLNLRTEEGLPHFHRIIATVAKYDSNFGRWNNLWTAEEDRHGCVLRDYVREARLFDFRSVEERQFDYIYAGFNPVWVGRSPYELFVYTTLQEKATQLSHDNTGIAAGNYEPLLQEILKKIKEDEARHYAFYLNLFKKILECDPNEALVAASRILPHIDMPGISSTNFKEYLDVTSRIGIYTLRSYKEVVEGVIHSWGITGFTALSEAGVKAQEAILKLPSRLTALTERIEHAVRTKSFSFDVIYGREFVLDGNIKNPRN